ncbi:cytochrome P450 [Allokutzneria albata]|uniref:Pentalenene oxygenase n=1 Tax=Allokutzneria albata TaxID=211114 RepID=A0A1G9UQK0_ALLAB|nr:cytochrome P450 [Allokutzneria albata]SDM62231.1 pentalenene oxygenase [Allokutzneria albata]
MKSSRGEHEGPGNAVPGALPLLGHIVPLLRDPQRFLTSLPKSGDLVQIRIGPFRASVVCDPELTREILVNDRTFDKGGPLYDRVREVVGNGLGTCPHEEHRRQRRLTQPAFHPSRMEGYARVMAEQIADVLGSWQDGQTVDAFAEMLKLAARIAGATMLSSALGAEELAQVGDDLTTVTAGFGRRALMFPPLDTLPTPGNLRYVRARSRLRSTISAIVEDYRRKGTDHGDLLSILLNTGVTDVEIDDQVLTFFAAGADTSAIALAWMLHLLSQHPGTQERLHAELAAVVGDRDPEWTDLPGLELTGRVVRETLRLHPPSWIFTRTTTVDSRIGRHAVPAGTVIIYSPYLIHHLPDLYPDPRRFDPDRWLPDRAASRPRSAFVGFGAGARKCIGDAFAVAELTLSLATIATRWHVLPASRRKVRAARSALASPKNLRLLIQARPKQRKDASA